MDPVPLIRDATAADTAAIVALNQQALRAVGALPADPAWSADLRRIAQVYQHGGGAFLVIEILGTVVGMGALRPRDAATVELTRMRIDPAHQGRGLGRLLLAELLARATAAGFATAVLSTTEQQVAAQRLYGRAGFTPTGRGQELGFTVLGYSRALTPAR